MYRTEAHYSKLPEIVRAGWLVYSKRKREGTGRDDVTDQQNLNDFGKLRQRVHEEPRGETKVDPVGTAC